MDSRYWSRLKSFTILTWFSKPPSLSPTECAKYGFSNTNRDEITCVQCGKKLVVKPGNWVGADVLREKHWKGCGYRVGEAVEWEKAEEFSGEEYDRRLGTINRGVVHIPAISLPQLSQHAQHPLKPLEQFPLSQIYALFGWEAESETSLQCGVCHTTVLLTATEEIDRDPILGHREYCPWVNVGGEGMCGWRFMLRRVEG